MGRKKRNIFDLVALDMREVAPQCADKDDVEELAALFYDSASAAAKYLSLPRGLTGKLRDGLPQYPHSTGYAEGRIFHVRVDNVHDLLWGLRSGYLQAEFKATVSHEMHHCARNAVWPSPVTLGETLVTEGLAMRFESQVSGVDTLYTYDSPEIQAVRCRAVRLLHTLADGYDAYDFGVETANPVMRDDVYALAEVLMSDFLEEKGLTAAEGAEIPANLVLEWWAEKDHMLTSDHAPPENEARKTPHKAAARPKRRNGP